MADAVAGGCLSDGKVYFMAAASTSHAVGDCEPGGSMPLPRSRNLLVANQELVSLEVLVRTQEHS